MSEEIRKINESEAEVVKLEEVIPETVVAIKTLADFEADLKQAQDSRVSAYKQFIQPIDDTIVMLQKRFDEAKKLILVAKVSVK